MTIFSKILGVMAPWLRLCFSPDPVLIRADL